MAFDIITQEDRENGRQVSPRKPLWGTSVAFLETGKG